MADPRNNGSEPLDEELKLSYEKEIRRPFTDSLTGLFHHGFFQIFLDYEIGRARRYATSFTLGLIDIDSFALYNARYGALQGDRMLQKIAEIISITVRQADLAARYSGDIFAILLTTVDADAASIPAERIRASIEHAGDIPLTVSIGLASFPRDATSKDELLERAKAALQQAKIRGKNRIHFFQRTLFASDDERPRILVVDDNPFSLKIMKALLAPLHVEIITATTGKEALYLLDKVEVDLVLLDVMLPDMDGFKICYRLKGDDATRMIPVMLVTALDDMESKIKGIEAGADDFITKPPNKVELLARTKSLIRLKRLNNNLTSIENVLFSLANSVEAKDVGTQGHIERVSNMALSLGKKMGLSSGKIDALRIGGMLHDIGKIGIPEELLNKPQSLNPEESEYMKRHPEIGYRICLPLKKVLGSALDVIRHHHERLDGSGYPDNLKGAEISLEARIMAVVDMYDALITDRPYRQGLPKDQVLAILSQEAMADRLDPKVVENLRDILLPPEN
jgi:putative two-component system response regulator